MRYAAQPIAGLLVLALTVSAASAEAVQLSGDAGVGTENAIVVTSPDGHLSFRVWSDQGAPRYEILQDEDRVVSPSALGLRFAEAINLDTRLQVTSVERGVRDETWEQPWGERQFVRDHHNELVVSFRRTDAANEGFDLRVRAFDGGVGFRYEVLGDAGEARALVDEVTGFALPEESEAWWIPAAGWNRYEYLYETTPLGEVDRAHTPFTARLPDGGPHVAIHEAALVDYSGMYLDQRRGGAFEAELAPGSDGVKVHVTGEFVTPWRTIQIADDAVGLINSDLILNLNEPNVLGDVAWVEPGKYVGIWWGMHIRTMSWGSGPIHGATNENVREYIDFAAENGFDGVLVEGWNYGWDGDWFSNGAIFSFTESYPDFDLEALSDYALERGVRIIGHHETSGHLTNYENQIEDAFDLYQEHGVTQVKTGYVADGQDLIRLDENGEERREWHYGQYTVNHHIRVLEAAAERQISINAHEPVKDTGLRRTYPNWISREGARGQEFNAWGVPPNPPEHIPLLAYTRMLSGPMDFTPGIFDLTFHGFDAPSRVETTLAKQLALYVVLYSPIQMAADLPENYEARPDAFQFIRDVPTDWAHSEALAGEVGDYVVFARAARDSREWFVGGVTDEDAREVEVNLDFLDPDETYLAQIYRDGADADWETRPYDIEIEPRQVNAQDRLSVHMAPGGGFAIRLVPVSEGE